MTEATITNCFDDTVAFNDYGGLKCKCGCENLHHERVTIFNRTEDEDRVRVAETDGVNCVMSIQDNDKSENPSSRRDGLIINTWCESGCQERLAIYQHKGATFFKWL